MNYTIVITDEERVALAKVLKRLSDLLADAKPFANSNGAVVPPPPPPAILGSSISGGSILWAKGKVDNESYALTVRVAKVAPGTTKSNSESLYVSWGNPGAQIMATCFDTELFPPIWAALKSEKPIKFYLRKRGQYQNIVGVLVQ